MGNDEMEEIRRHFGALAIRECIDSLVDGLTYLQEFSKIGKDIRLCTREMRVQVLDGIDILADSLGMALKSQMADDDGIGFRYGYSFMYRGVTFVQWKNEKADLEGQVCVKAEREGKKNEGIKNCN